MKNFLKEFEGKTLSNESKRAISGGANCCGLRNVSLQQCIWRKRNGKCGNGNRR